jgi:hypothetical protein
LLNRCTGKTVPGVRIPPAPYLLCVVVFSEKLFKGTFPQNLTLIPVSITFICMQKILLWSLAGAVSLLLLVNLALGLGTRGSINKIQAVQAQVANGPQMEMVLRNLSIRIAMAGEKDAAFKELLKKHELNVKLEEGK